MVSTSVRIESESDEFQVVSVVGVKPTWRDIISILRGTYVPQVEKVDRLTAAGTNRILKKAYTSERLEAQMASSPLLDGLDLPVTGKASIPLKKRR